MKPTTKKAKKVKKINKHITITKEKFEEMSATISDQERRAKYYEDKFLSKSEEVSELEKELIGMRSFKDGRIAKLDEEIMRLMEIIRWQINPNAALECPRDEVRHECEDCEIPNFLKRRR